MPENDTADRNEQAEERTRETRSFMRSVRRATRRKYTPEEKIRIVLEGFRREATVSDLCRREGINPANYYSWTKEFMEAGKERLTLPDSGREVANVMDGVIAAAGRDSVHQGLIHERLKLGAYRVMAGRHELRQENCVHVFDGVDPEVCAGRPAP